MLKQAKKFDASTIALFVLLAAGAILRLYHYTGFSLMNDELSPLHRAQYSTLYDVIKHGVMEEDSHPFGVILFIRFWTGLFGISEAALRFPFVIMGILSVGMTYLVAKKWFGKNTALFTAACIAFLQYFILYSQIARPYVVGLLFCLAAVYCWTYIIFEPGTLSRKQKLYYYAGYILSSSICMYTHYIAFLFVLMVGITGLFYIKKPELKYYALAGCIILLLYIPQLPVFYHHFLVGNPGEWLGKPDKLVPIYFLGYAFNSSVIIIALVIAVFAGSLLFNRKNIRFSHFHTLCLIWFILPFSIIYTYTFLRMPMYQDSLQQFSFPFFIMFCFSFLPKGNLNIRTGSVLAILTLAGIYSTVKERGYYHTQHFGVFRELAQSTIEWNNTYGKENITRAINIHSPYYINYYLDMYKQTAPFVTYSLDNMQDVAALQTITENSKTDYFEYAWSNKASMPEIEEVIRHAYPCIEDKRTYTNSEVTLFSKKKNGCSPLLYNQVMDFEAPSEHTTQANAFSGNYSFKLDNTSEYSQGYQLKLSDLGAYEGAVVWASAWIYVPDPTTEITLAVSIDDKDGKNIIWNGTTSLRFGIKKNSWSQVFMSLTIPATAQGSDILKCFTWTPSKKPAYVDKLQLSVRKKD